MTPAPKPHQIFWEDAKPEDFENATTSCWIEGVGDVSTEYERKFVQRFGVALRTLSHTSPQAPRPPCEECIYQAQAASAAKAERERAAKQWSDLSVWIHEQMTIAEGTEHYFTYLKIYAHIQSLRAQQEPQQEGQLSGNTRQLNSSETPNSSARPIGTCSDGSPNKNLIACTLLPGQCPHQVWRSCPQMPESLMICCGREAAALALAEQEQQKEAEAGK